jgi:putative YhbY family RNA-binding protein
MELTSAQRRQLRARAHSLHPVVGISQHGLSEAVLAEIDRSLKAHELIKIRIYGEERAKRGTMLVEICNKLEASPVQHIGNLLVIYRANPEEKKSPPEPRPAAKAKLGGKSRTRATPSRPATPRRRTSHS